MPPKIRGNSQQIWGAKKRHVFDNFFATSALDTAYIRNETSHRQTKMLVSIYNVFPTRWSTFRDLWSRNGSDPLPHCDSSYENSAFSGIAGTPGFPHKGHWNKANQILPHIRRLKGLTIHRKISGKFVPIFFRQHRWKTSHGISTKNLGRKKTSNFG